MGTEISNDRRNKMMWRFSLVSAALIAVFWGAWYLATGSVPVVSNIKMTPNWTYELPFAMSRWWDVLLGPFYSIILVWAFTQCNNKEYGWLVCGPVIGLAVWLVGWMDFGLIGGPVIGLAGELAFLLVCGLVCIFKTIFSTNFCQKIGRWLTAK